MGRTCAQQRLTQTFPTGMTTTAEPNPSLESLEEVVIRFAGDSGDGMQLTGTQFTNTSAALGNDLATFPDYPSEIRAPVGTLIGVSGFQVRFSAKDIHTPGDLPDVLVAMNPAAFKVNIGELKPGGLLIVNTGNFGKKDLEKAKYESNPLEDGKLKEQFQVVELDLNEATLQATAESGLAKKDALRAKNLLALGMLYWVYSRPLENTERWLESKFAKKPDVLSANLAALHAGHAIAENSELFQNQYQVEAAPLKAGTYRNIMGNAATALGLVAASRLSKLPLFLGTYPITPASDILHALSRYKNYGVVTFQAEDEIAGICTAIGASFAGSLAVTTTSGPGLALKGEALGLAVMTELPLVVINVQRGGPSTGLPTKTEQSDLFQAVFGRHGECPLPVIAAQSPADCFMAAIEASRIALKYMTPVVLLTDGYIANGAEPFRIPQENELERFPVEFYTDAENFQPYSRDPETLARPWAIPGTPGLEHRIGGLEKEDITGDVCYDSENHHVMTELREKKVMGIADSYAPLKVFGPEKGKLLVLGWGSTFGAIRGAVESKRESNLDVAQLHLRNVWPLPKDLGTIMSNYEHILIPEMNRGQLARLIRSEFLRDVETLSKMKGRPFTTTEISEKIESILG
ncbi:MAG: 2-oxoacid:acceptor oxidoreductase subunit alpha [Planctomycetota bacterium]|nr:2-oxoacid:acceptor oxidoreductase subunit alpha [Planctomycetota bacterium]